MFVRRAAVALLAFALAACPDSKPTPDLARTGKRSARTKRQLASLPYVNWIPVRPEDRGRNGVTRHNPDRAYRGITLYNSLPRTTALVVDMYGRTLHSWSSQRGQPTAAELEWHRIWSHLDFIGWHHVEATPDGSLYVMLHMHGLLKLDRSSKPQWLVEIGAHHDLDFTDSGEIYVLTADKVRLRHGKQTLRILDDNVVRLGPDGKERRRFSLLKVLRRDPRTAPLLKKKLDWAATQFAAGFAVERLMALAVQKNKEAIRRTTEAFAEILTDRFKGTPRIQRMLMTSLLPMDPLHANGLQVLPRDVEGLGRKGDLLISVRELDLLLVVDPKTGKVGWTFGPGVLQRQHQPSVLDNGHVLVFDNGTFAKRSRVLEVDPRTRKIVWTFKTSKPADFFSPIRGGCQRLPNGNTLIVESERGRAFEVTRDGTLVWEFFNPDLKDPFMGRKRAPIYRMTRLPPGYFPWLKRDTGENR